jgi:hypothetical protein
LNNSEKWVNHEPEYVFFLGINLPTDSRNDIFKCNVCGHIGNKRELKTYHRVRNSHV